jgi:DivIVA domain-containing protein
VALDRQDIQKRDFPIARRGYDPDAVDAHLRAVADEIDETQRRGPSAASLASAASEQVKSIVEAAETTATDIRRQAEEEASMTRQRATTEADKARADAAAQAQSHVGQVEEATKVMLQRVDAMESELGALMESLRTGANRLTADLTLLRGNMGELRTTTVGAEGPAAEAALDEEAAVAAAQEAAGSVGPPAEAAAEAEALAEAPAEAEEGKAPTVEAPPEETATAPDDSEGARLIALNMALNGTPREETDRYLAENFQLEDRAGLLDEVYARVG